jgi:hypothetical protein
MVTVDSEGGGVQFAGMIALLLAHCICLLFVEPASLDHIFVVAVLRELGHHSLEMLLRRGVCLVDRKDLLLERLEELLKPRLRQAHRVALLTRAADVHRRGVAGAARLVGGEVVAPRDELVDHPLDGILLRQLGDVEVTDRVVSGGGADRPAVDVAAIIDHRLESVDAVIQLFLLLLAEGSRHVPVLRLLWHVLVAIRLLRRPQPQIELVIVA